MTKRFYEDGEQVKLGISGRSVTGTINGEPVYRVWIPDNDEGYTVTREAGLLTPVPPTGDGPFRTPQSLDDLTTLERMNEVKAPDSSREESVVALLERGRQSQIAIREQFEKLTESVPKPPSPAEALVALRDAIRSLRRPNAVEKLATTARALLNGMGSTRSGLDGEARDVVYAYKKAAMALYVEGVLESPHLPGMEEM